MLLKIYAEIQAVTIYFLCKLDKLEPSKSNLVVCNSGSNNVLVASPATFSGLAVVLA